MANDECAAKGALDAARDHLNQVRSQTNDKGVWADAQRGVDAAQAHYNGTCNANASSNTKPAGNMVDAIVNALGGKSQ